ncbi:MAG: tRNA (guanosine(46)-N7)-methyltransferase TrmB [Alphaproteobacteria bacterium]|nr:tRNA (guanosine(46)-N7)-methyltransferase TrmB [Alphaproteobacteria bacterium]
MGRAPPDTPGLKRLFGRKRGHKLRAGRAAELEGRLPDLSPPLDGEGPLDLRAVFAARGHPVRQARLEIGFGGGEHLLAEATAHPETGFLGVEPFLNGLARAVAETGRLGLANVLLAGGDARDLLPRLADGSLARVDLLYPDPWPKARHHKRRFVSPASVAELARVIAPGGELRVASDIPSYVDWTLAHVLGPRVEGAFVFLAECAADWEHPWAGWPGTRYEAKALREGRVPTYLRFARS